MFPTHRHIVRNLYAAIWHETARETARLLLVDKVRASRHMWRAIELHVLTHDEVREGVIMIQSLTNETFDIS